MASTSTSSATSASAFGASQPTRCAAAESAAARRGKAFESGRRGPTTTTSWCSRDFIGSPTSESAPAPLAASCAAAAGAVAARRPAAPAAAVQQAATALGAVLGDVKAAAQRGSAARRPQGGRAGAAPACGRAERSRGAARCPRVPYAPYGTCLYHFCIAFRCAFAQACRWCIVKVARWL